MGKYTIGIDFGTGSGRVAIVNVKNGEVVGIDETTYKHGVIQDQLPKSSTTLKRNSALQHPQDYLDVLEKSIPKALNVSGVNSKDIIGLGVDFTSCTMLPVDENFTPMCFNDKWKDDPHAWVKLWKHHSAYKQAIKINDLAKERNESWLKRYGGIISSEWMLPKVLETLEESIDLYEETSYFMEASDWITTLLTGQLKRNSCAAGFKGIWSKEIGYASKSFLKEIHPRLENVYENKLSGEVVSSGDKAGFLTSSFSKHIGLKEGTPISTALIDAHAGVPGSGVTTSGKMVLVMGTSTCHMLLNNKEVFVDGISGVVQNGIIPGFFAYEGGQAAVGDIFSWFIKNNTPAYIIDNAKQQGISTHSYLEILAEKLDPGSNGLIALDWHNGCRTPLVDTNLSGAFIGLNLSTKPEEMYRSLIEATAYGTKMIIEQFKEKGIEIKELVACGGLPLRNELLMQIYSDVTGMTIKIVDSTITPAIGSAMYGAVAAGLERGGYNDITQAAKVMTNLKDLVYKPNPQNTTKYNHLYNEYKKLTHYFSQENNLMKRLKNTLPYD